MTAIHQTDRAAALSRASAFPVTVVPSGVQCRGTGEEVRTCSLADLHLLEHLARDGFDGIDEAITSIAARCGVDVGDLRTFLAEIKGRNLT